MASDDGERSSLFEGEGGVNEWIPDPEPDRRCCVRYGLYIVNSLLLIAAVVLLAIGVASRTSFLAELCHVCYNLGLAAQVVGTIFTVSALGGFIALYMRMIGGLVAYLITIIFLALAVLGLTIASIVFASDGIDISKEWRHAVGKQDRIICHLQAKYRCSGWDVCCGPTTTDALGNSTRDEVCSWDPSNCLSSCDQTNTFQDTCRKSIQDWIKTMIVPFVIGILCVLGFMTCGLMGSNSLRRQMRHAPVDS